MKAIGGLRVLSDGQGMLESFLLVHATTDCRLNAGWVFVKFFGKVQPLCPRALRGLEK